MMERSGGQRGSLVAVGTGLCLVGQLTVEAMAWMRRADRLLYIVVNEIAEAVVRELNPGAAESLCGFYVEGRRRSQIYAAMAERALCCVRDGYLTCFVSYGHPGIFANPVHDSVRRARAEGYEARILPGISALDCLFADLEIDPAVDGFCSFDSTDFLQQERAVDTTAGLILWQAGLVGDPYYRSGGYDQSRLPELIERLTGFYPPGHVGCIYQAASLPWEKPVINEVRLDELASAKIAALATLYIPPVKSTSNGPRTRLPAATARIAVDPNAIAFSPQQAEPGDSRNLS